MALSSVLIANRGEIAVRLIRACHDEGLDAIAVYSDADRDAPHVRGADKAIHIGPAEATASYLNGDALIMAALTTGADAIHPGYGFLAENADFAQACIDAGLTFCMPLLSRTIGRRNAARFLGFGFRVAHVLLVDGVVQLFQLLTPLLGEVGDVAYPLLGTLR